MAKKSYKESKYQSTAELEDIEESIVEEPIIESIDTGEKSKHEFIQSQTRDVMQITGEL